MKVRVFLFIIIFIILNISIAFAEVKFKNSETGFEVVIEDNANIFTDEEEEKLSKQMEQLTEKGNIILKSIENNYTSTKEYANKYYHKLYGANISGTLLLFDMDERYIWIFSDGENYKLLTTEKANTITDNVYKYAMNKEYYKCASEAFDEINKVINKVPISEPMKYAVKIIISFMLACLVVSANIVLISNTKYASNKELLEKTQKEISILKLKRRKGKLKKELVTYDYIFSSISGHDSGGGGHDSGGGGHDSGGGGHDSHSSGGGGGHRF